MTIENVPGHEDMISRHISLFSPVCTFGRRIFVKTAWSVALDSPDHTSPQGTIEDFTDGSAFAFQFLNAFPKATTALDLGCATGTVPLGYRWAGLEAYGLEGSDAPKIARLGSWNWFPGIQETCDISRPFDLLDADGNRFMFDLITAWGVMEHIHPDRAGTCLANIAKHLKPGGRAVLAIDLGPNPWHQGVARRSRRSHWLPVLDEHFQIDEALRGSRAWAYSRPFPAEKLSLPRETFGIDPLFQGDQFVEGRFYVWLRAKSYGSSPALPPQVGELVGVQPWESDPDNPEVRRS